MFRIKPVHRAGFGSTPQGELRDVADVGAFYIGLGDQFDDDRRLVHETASGRLTLAVPFSFRSRELWSISSKIVALALGLVAPLAMTSASSAAACHSSHAVTALTPQQTRDPYIVLRLGRMTGRDPDTRVRFELCRQNIN
jgi:hypothetical protein